MGWWVRFGSWWLLDLIRLLLHHFVEGCLEIVIVGGGGHGGDGIVLRRRGRRRRYARLSLRQVGWGMIHIDMYSNVLQMVGLKKWIHH